MMLLQSVILFMPPVPTALPWAMEFDEEGNERLQKSNRNFNILGQ